MEVRVLGALEVAGPEGMTLEVSGARLRRLIVRLAADPARVVSSADLVDAVWGDDPPADRTGSLQTLVSRARRVLGDASLVQQSHHGYRLAVDPAQVDVSRFRVLARQGRDQLSAGDAAAAVTTLGSALALWRGPALVDADGLADGSSVSGPGWADPLIARLEEERLDALAARIDADLALGRAAEVVPELEDLTHAYPLRERHTEQLMRALAATGRSSEALTAYERLRSTLADTLGSDPSAALRELHVSLLREADASRAPGAGRPMLPAGLTSFLGRETEQRRVLDLLEQGRMATLVGPGGAGKTRLATEAGRAWQSARQAGAAIVQLAPVRDESAVLSAFLAALDLREAHVLDRTRETRRSLDDHALLVAALTAGPFLLVVDNCEHLLDAAARLVEDLLERCADLRVLATSREPLGIDGEALCVLPPLGLPPWDVALEDAQEYAAVRLLVERASAVSSAVVLDEATLPAVVEIVRRLDGLPLAIELAAARTRVLPVAEIATRLSDRFRLLTGGRRTAMPRHQTLRAVVEWSWDLLCPAERLLAERLAVFPAGSTLEAAIEVCADDELRATDVPATLDALVDKSLLTVDDRTGLRYRMLETIREFGVDRLADRGEVERARRRHADWFAAVVSRETRRLYGREQLDAASILELERDNVVAALRFLGDSGDAESALRLVLEMSWYWSMLSAHHEARMWLEFAVAVPGDVPPGARELAMALSMLTSGMEDEDFHDEDGARRAGEASDLLETVPDPDYAQPQSLVLRAMLAFFGERPERSQALMERANADDNPWVRAAMRMLRAALAENDGDVETMRDCVETAYAEFSVIGDRWGLATVLSFRAGLQTLDGQLHDALDSYREAARLMAEMGAHSDAAVMAMRSAGLRLRLDDLDGARAELHQVLDVSNEGFGPVFAAAMSGVIALRENDIETIRALRTSLEAKVQEAKGPGGAEHGRALLISVLTLLHLADDDVPAAVDSVTRGYPMAVRTHDMPIIAGHAVTTAKLLGDLGRPADAAALLGGADRIRGAGDPTDLVAGPLRAELVETLGPQGFAQAYDRGWSLPKQEAVLWVDPTTWHLA